MRFVSFVVCLFSLTLSFAWLPRGPLIKQHRTSPTKLHAITIFKKVSKYAEPKKLLSAKEKIEKKEEDRLSALSEQQYLDEQRAKPPAPVVGELLTGEVAIIKDTGLKLTTPACDEYVFLPENEISMYESTSRMNKRFKVGQSITGRIIGYIRNMWVISTRKLELQEAMANITAVFKSQEVVEATVTEINRYGAMVQVMGVLGFLPASHVVGLLNEDWIDTTLNVKVLNVSMEDNRVTVSHRLTYGQGTQPVTLHKLYNATCTGVKRAAFFELDGVQRLAIMYANQVSKNHTEDIEKVFEPGDRVKVIVMDDGAVSGRIVVSTKVLEVEPGDMLKNWTKVFEGAEERYAAMNVSKDDFKPTIDNDTKVKVGELYNATVTGIAEYGAFIVLSNGVKSLLHKSQITSEQITAVSDYFKVNDAVKVVIIDDGAENGKIGVSTKVLEVTGGDLGVDPSLVFENAEAYWASVDQMAVMARHVPKKRSDSRPHSPPPSHQQLLASPHVDAALLSSVIGEEVIDRDDPQRIESLLSELVTGDEDYNSISSDSRDRRQRGVSSAGDARPPMTNNNSDSNSTGYGEGEDEFPFNELDNINDDLTEEYSTL